uniref:ORF13 n=1 Tax=Nitrosopumilaceae spindle-shaped virus TaxID=3065433 RepID=A0AAT9J9I4_9VIRU
MFNPICTRCKKPFKGYYTKCNECIKEIFENDL